MPFKSSTPIVSVELDSMKTIDTGNAENLFGLWSVFSKCADSMEDGKRLENLSWRLWNRETFCCAPDHASPSLSARWPHLLPSRQPQPTTTSNHDLPELSSSASSTASDALVTPYSSQTSSRPHLLRQDSAISRTSLKHISPIDLQNIVTSIKKDSEKEKPQLPPLPPKPPHSHIIPESSTSTVATTLNSVTSGMSPHAPSEASTASTEFSATNIVRGFEPGRISSSLRSKTHLAVNPSPSGPTSSLRTPAATAQSQQKSKAKGATFQLGGSSGSDEENSFKHFTGHSSLSDGLRKSGVKQASFREDVKVRTYEQEDVFESDTEDEDQSSSAIEDDEMEDGEWEDAEDDHSGQPSFKDEHMFQRVDSRANLRSRPSLLTAMMHENDRATALQNAASRSTPAIRRSRTSSPNGPSFPTSPLPDASASDSNPIQISRSKPIIMTTSNTHQPALSPRTTRRNMLSSELTESLRKNLLWERQQKNSTTNAALKRRHTSNDMRNLRQYPGEPAPVAPSGLGVIKETTNKYTSSWTNNQTDFFTAGPDDLHERGW
ncbi:DUF1752-domain-containing protein [Eremomyces bilateralis CBS 781.70]|uniref:DUF1752-domain-containing protein n=1 Tax=Eremomyces bilateralis CBS 781.70 TaxID=1392243 RepID=A0A6G1FVP4_9PEZI|nr:DUF1752-domain-containing protein [Eremomyces bilateralis CBS 781.70]KAF1809776.1 DUF1752-domain-containing protein [Eremomyces bilateralis CBS 781.70]